MSTPIKNQSQGVNAPARSHWSNLLIKLGIPALIVVAMWFARTLKHSRIKRGEC